MADDHWWFRLAEKEPVRGKFRWNFYKQPPGMVEATPEDTDAAMGAGRWWKDNTRAENIKNLPDGYYQKQIGDKDLDWIQCYVGGKYVYVKEGKPVWHEYDDTIMVDEHLEPDPSPAPSCRTGLWFDPCGCLWSALSVRQVAHPR